MWGFKLPLLKRGVQKLPIFGGFTTISRLSANLLGTKGAIIQAGKSFQLRRVPTFPQIW